MKSLEMIQNCNSLEELVNEIKDNKPKKRNRFTRFIVNFIKRMEVNSDNNILGGILVAAYLCLLAVTLTISTTTANRTSLFLSIAMILIGFTAANNKGKFGENFAFFGMFPSMLSGSLSLYFINSIAGIIVGSLVTWTFIMLGLYPNKKEEVKEVTKSEKRAKQLNILSEWLKDQEEKIVESLKERKSSIRNLKDQLQKHLNTLESKYQDDFLSSKYGENINGKIEVIENQLSSVELSLKSLEEKEKVMTQAIEETINNILPEFRKEQEFLQEMIEIDQVLDKADTKISETKELIRNIDQNFINMFTKVNSALEQASVMNQALIEVTNDNFKNINRISEPIESFDIDELQEVVSSTRLKVHS